MTAHISVALMIQSSELRLRSAKCRFDGQVEIVSPPVWPVLMDLVQAARTDLLLVSLYVGATALDKVSDRANGVAGKATLMLSATAENVVGGSVDLGAVERFAARFNAAVIHVLRLHAKVYVEDATRALVTSANLTHNGLFVNFEYGILVKDSELVASIRSDLQSLKSVGVPLGVEQLQRLRSTADRCRQSIAEAGMAVKAAMSDVAELLRQSYDEHVREARSRTGSTTSIFRRAVLQVLTEHGAMRTGELNPLIQQLIPDLCDDMIDRVIGGVHFGKNGSISFVSRSKH